MRVRHVTPILGFALAVTASALFPPRPAMAQRTPSDIELRVAYCAALIRANSNWANQQVDLLLDPRSFESPLDPSLEKERQDLLVKLKQLREEDERILRRFRLYLLPRLHEIDTLQVTIAMKRGEEDGNKMVPDMVGCVQSCQAPASNHKNCIEACFKSKELYAMGDRLKMCREPTWLPF